MSIGRISLEIELGGRRIAAVASDAILGNKRLHGLRELLIQRGVSGVGRRQRGDYDDSQRQTQYKGQDPASHQSQSIPEKRFGTIIQGRAAGCKPKRLTCRRKVIMSYLRKVEMSY